MKRFYKCFAVLVALMLSAALRLAPAAQAEGAYWIGVDVTNQITTVYRVSDDSVVRRMLCSTGLGSTPTPIGTFYLPSKTYSAERTEWYYFTKYKCWAKYATRIHGGILFHSVIFSKADESTVRSSTVYALGSRASHGCIRLMVEDARWIALNCPVGTKVEIYEGEADPVLKASLTGRYTTLKQGSSGPSVKALQKQLRACGWYDGTETGSFGEATAEAVRAFQEAAGLSVDGVAGTKTQSELYDANPKVGTRVTLAVGERSRAVSQLQQLLKEHGFFGGAADGIFGEETKSAVMACQLAAGEHPDGVATPALQERLISDGTLVAETIQPEDEQPAPTTELKPIGNGTVHVRTVLGLRESASAGGRIFERLPNDTKLIVLDNLGDWLLVNYNGQIGYVSSQYVAVEWLNPDGTVAATPVPTAEPTAEPTPAPREEAIGVGYIRTNGGALAVRGTPSTDGELLFRLANGTEFTVIEDLGDWVKLRYANHTGYALKDYLTIRLNAAQTTEPAETQAPEAAPDATGEPTAEPTPTVEPTPTPTPAPTQPAIGKATVHTNGSDLSIREAANITAGRLGAISTGETADVLEVYDEWVKIRHNGIVGYAARQYLTLSGVPETPAPTATPAPTSSADVIGRAVIRTNTKMLTLRASMSTASDALDKMPPNATADALAVFDEWVKIRYNGVVGYASRQYVSVELSDGTLLSAGSTGGATATAVPTAAPAPTAYNPFEAPLPDWIENGEEPPEDSYNPFEAPLEDESDD